VLLSKQNYLLVFLCVSPVIVLYSDSSLACAVFNILMFCLSSRRWFVLFLACVSYLVLVLVSGDGD
jgi:hypothetical protein